MKTTFKYFLAAVCAAPMILSGCQRELAPEGPATINVRIADNDGLTRTSYDQIEGKFAWTAGDEIALHFQGGKYETFAVTPNTDAATGTIISSSVGGKVRNDFAIYPASAAVVTADEAAPKVNFPAEYDMAEIVAAGEHYSPALLVAENTAGEDLAFYHVGGLVRFNLKDVDPTTTKIVVSFDKNVTGEFDVITDDDAEPIPYVETATGTNNTVTFTLTSAEIGSDGTLELNIPVPCGTYAWVRVESYAGDTKLDPTLTHDSPLEFSRHHGKRVAFVETDVELYIGDNSDPAATELAQIKLPAQYQNVTPTLGNEGGILTLSSSFVSYLVDGENVAKVPIKLRYSTNGTRWEELPDWISVGPTVDMTGSLPDFPQELTVIIDPLPNEIPMTAFGVPMPAGSRTANLQAMPAVSGVVNLATTNVATGESVAMSTANCYVVNAPGTYTFPFVYGNGVKDGNVNEPAFRGMLKNGSDYEFRPDAEVNVGTGTTHAHILGRFQDHRGEHIVSPYIAQQLGAANYKAKVLWMDQPGLIDMESVAYVPGDDASAEDDCIQFTVTEDGISQGNAVIGVFDESDTIVWSWHIWVTDENLAVHKTIQGFNVSPVNLGWCNKVVSAKYTRRTFYLQVIQDYTGARMDNTFNRVKITLGTTGSTTVVGNNPYYQPGRKDPMPGFDGDADVTGDKVVYPPRSENPYYYQYSLLDMSTLAGLIQNPYKHYYQGGSPSRFMDITYGNVWNSTQTKFTSGASDDPVTKTIYDPCPVGYRMPAPSIFVGISFDDMVSAGSSLEGIASFTFKDKGTAVFYCEGLREKYIRYNNGNHLYYLTSNMQQDGTRASARFVGQDYYRYTPTRQNRLSTILNAANVLPQVDE